MRAYVARSRFYEIGSESGLRELDALLTGGGLDPAVLDPAVSEAEAER